jgi:CRP-like cAMP-binding protein
LKTLEATQVYCLSHAQLSEFAVAHPEILWRMKVLYENKMVHYENRLRIIRTRSTKEGLDLFLKRFKGIYQRIPAKYVASYLNITASTLSRLQNKTE